MRSYDDYKLASPEDDEVPECPMCGDNGLNKYQGYCSSYCLKGGDDD